MPLSNDFLPFGTAGTAPVLSQTSYAAITPSNGFGPGILPKENLNKALRQGSVIASMIGAFMNSQGQNANDDGNLTTLGTNFAASLQAFVALSVSSLVVAGVPYGFKVGPLVVQFGSTTFTDPPSGVPGYTGTITFPTAFPTACQHVFFGFQVASGGSAPNNLQAAVTAQNTTAFTFQIQEWSAVANPGTLHWLAIGY